MGSVNGKAGITCIDGAVGFGVVQVPPLGAYCATVPSPSFAFVRLSKEIVRVAEGPLNLLETTNIYILYKKTITSKFSQDLYFMT